VVSILGSIIIVSDGYSFRFDRSQISALFNGVKMPWQIIPIWTDSIELHNDISRCNR